MNTTDTKKSSHFVNSEHISLLKGKEIQLLQEDEKNRPYIELYTHVISEVDLYNKDILEVNSGRGIGASYINRYYTPKSYTGLIRSDHLVNFCNRHYNESGLSFIKGSEKYFPFDKESFDLVISIGASEHCNELPKFLNEVYRVLRKDSIVIFADMIEKRKIETVKHYLRMAGFTIEHKNNITQNISKLISDSDFQRILSNKEHTPGFVKKAFRFFMKTKDSDVSESLHHTKCAYMVFKLKKVN